MDSKNNIILDNKTLKQALEKINLMSDSMAMVLFVINNKKQVVGSLTDGDIRRALLKGLSINDNVSLAMESDFKYIYSESEYEKINSYIKQNLKIVPIVEKDKTLINLINLSKIKAKTPVSAIIMAGGKGVRLKPYTNDIPKPMLELAGKPILARNIDRLIAYGIEEIYISINHMKEQIISYINKNYSVYNIRFIEENSPLGTIGSLKLVDNYKYDDLLVMNADILTNIDFYDFFTNYKNFKDNMSVATFNIRINIPYGILDTTDKHINSLIEKPSFTYYSNAGIYLINKDMLKYIPYNQKFDSTELMEVLLEKQKKVSHFPIRGYWLDIGNAQNYAKAQDDVRFIKF